MMKLPSLAEAQKAIKGGKDPRAFLHLGILYAQGIGTEQNDILANYFIRKALDMGCQEAKEYLNMKYIREHLKFFYPEYNKEKAISDILNYRNTIDADILYSLCTSDNTMEIYVKSQESLLSQLFAPVSREDCIWEYINTDMLSKDESELAQCLVNLNYSYDKICQKYDVEREDLHTLESLDLYPYIKIPSLVELRRQAFRCLLSIRDTDPNIRFYLACLDSDEKLLKVCETIKDQDIQLFLISFVELNIDIESIEITSLGLLKAYWNNNLLPLVEHLNNYVARLSKLGIRHNLPVFGAQNLPPIDLCSCDD